MLRRALTVIAPIAIMAAALPHRALPAQEAEVIAITNVNVVNGIKGTFTANPRKIPKNTNNDNALADRSSHPNSVASAKANPPGGRSADSSANRIKSNEPAAR